MIDKQAKPLKDLRKIINEEYKKDEEIEYLTVICRKSNENEDVIDFIYLYNCYQSKNKLSYI